MKVYRGYSDRTDAMGPTVVTVTDDQGTRPLRHEARHNPTGFSWGYGGSGPADLARSLLADHLGYVPEPGVYQRFKWATVARWPQGGRWTITSTEIAAWLVADAAPAP